MIANRTLAKAQQLAEKFSPYGNIRAVELGKLPAQSFDVIINATSSGLHGGTVAINDEILRATKAVFSTLSCVRRTKPKRWFRDVIGASGAFILFMARRNAKHYAVI